MKIIIFCTEDWHFAAHLMPIAKGAKKQGHQVKIITRISNNKEQILSQGLEVIPLNLERFSLNIFKELKVIYKIWKIYKEESPDVVQHFGIKPILYGNAVAILSRIPKIINTFLGMGFVFISDKLWVKAIRVGFISLLKLFMLKRESIIIVQNKDDRELLLKENIAKPSQVYAQCSVGVDINDFPVLPEPEGKPVFALIARMIWDKGIAEFIAAAEIIKNKGLDAEFWLVGAPDPNNSRSVTEEQIIEWQDRELIKWLGFCKDIRSIWEKAHVAVLPSYREGLSRSLLEAAAYGRALITTDVPGCRELVDDQVNGLLVKSHDIDTLAKAMENLIVDKELRKALALRAREIVVNNYSEEVIVKHMLEFYQPK